MQNLRYKRSAVPDLEGAQAARGLGSALKSPASAIAMAGVAKAPSVGVLGTVAPDGAA
jgi:hypothetical protein